MATVDKHELLFSTDLKYFKALQLIGGRSIFDRYKIANTSIIGKYIDERYRSFLAYPVKEGNKIEFHGIKAKNDEPQILSDLQGDDAEKFRNIKAETVRHYQSKIDELKNAGKTKEADFLTDALKVIDDRFVFCYDDRVVLGAWGMQLRENVREDISEIRKVVRVRKPRKPHGGDEPSPLPEVLRKYSVHFNAGEYGTLSGESCVYVDAHSLLLDDAIPKVVAKDGYEFIGWDENPHGYCVIDDKEFIAQYRPKPVSDKKLPWWKRFWRWLTVLFAGKGCLKWLLKVLLFLLLLLLLLWLLRNCHGCSHSLPRGGAALSDNDSTWLREDPNRGHEGGIYDPENPYKPQPTPPGYEDILPPNQGVLPPIGDHPDTIPGNPSIIASRLNILMDNEDKSIMDLARDFKAKYPDEKYKVVYYDDIVKRMQIEVPKEEREHLKQVIPSQFAPDYDLFVFDETLFEGAYLPNDPAISDESKAWYLKAIHAPEAWGITRGSEKITVAIVDNGFDLRHPELSSKVVQPYNVWLHSDKIFPQEVDHGTHVAGTALAVANNGKGLCGVAPNCKFMPVQVADQHGLMTITSVLDGILYALYQGADVINISLGGSFTDLSGSPESAQQELIRNHFKEEERLWRHVMRIAANHNSTIVIAAGNDNVLAGIDALQRPELFVVVSAVDKNNQNYNKAGFSNYGQYSTISAPGVDIYSSVGKNAYQTKAGTSMAAPIVSGAVALIKSINDTITNKQIICILQNTGLETQGKIGKLVQLDKALQKVKSGDVLDCTPEPTTGDVQVLLSWNNYNDLDLKVVDPNGEAVWYKNRRTTSGGKLEIDMNVEYPDSKTPIENIYWEQGSAPSGTYNVYLLYYKRHENIAENPYKITVKHGSETEEYTGTVRNPGETIHICSFTLGDAENRQSSASQRLDRRLQLEQRRESLQRELERVNDELRRLGRRG